VEVLGGAPQHPRRAAHAPELEERTAHAATDASFEWPFVHQLLYRNEQNLIDSEEFIGRSRNMMLILGVGLGALIAWWGWRLGGTIAAVVATAFYAFDPNFLVTPRW
jgi:hypothetical protein